MEPSDAKPQVAKGVGGGVWARGLGHLMVTNKQNK
jgi:hypothetical protein